MAVIAPLAWIARPVAERLGVTVVATGDYLDTLHDVGLVFAVYVLVVLAMTSKSAISTGFWRRAAVPFQTWGYVALSLYVVHVAIIALWAHEFGRLQQNSLPGWCLAVVLPLLVALLWVRFVGNGPLEWLMGKAIGRPRLGVERFCLR